MQLLLLRTLRALPPGLPLLAASPRSVPPSPPPRPASAVPVFSVLSSPHSLQRVSSDPHHTSEETETWRPRGLPPAQHWSPCPSGSSLFRVGRVLRKSVSMLWRCLVLRQN